MFRRKKIKNSIEEENKNKDISIGSKGKNDTTAKTLEVTSSISLEVKQVDFVIARQDNECAKKENQINSPFINPLRKSKFDSEKKTMPVVDVKDTVYIQEHKTLHCRKGNFLDLFGRVKRWDE